MQAYAGTDIGCVRTMNQDGYFCSTTPIGPFPNLFIVADGMGGHQAGDLPPDMPLRHSLIISDTRRAAI